MPHLTVNPTTTAEVSDTELLEPGDGTHPRRASIRLGSLPLDSEQDQRFLQERIALFAKVTFFISAMFLLATTLADTTAEVVRYGTTGRVSHLVGTLVALALWRTLRWQHSFSPGSLQALDFGGTLAICWSFALLGHHTPQPFGFYTGLLAVTHVCITRAMIVPSKPLRTLAVAVAAFSALVVSRSLLPISSELAQLALSRGRVVLEAGLWSTAGTAVATVASTVIYGLQEKAAEARQLGQYTLEAKIGQGGMGQVYRAHHAMLRRPTAIKLLAGDGSERQLRRFEKEVQLTASLTHPNTISVYDYGRTPDGVFYYAMELLDGLNLEQLVQDHGPQPPGRVIQILLQACGALDEAHRAGLIHRDVKPANIHLCRRGQIPDFVKVLDFGLVRELNKSSDVSGSVVNAVIGTPLYLSPESILKPDGLDARADLYGLGGVAYFLATGTPPFNGNNAVELCAHHLHTKPEPPSARANVASDLEQVILACLAKDPRERPGSAHALARALSRCQDAGSWSEADAEAWWAEHSGQSALARAVPPDSREQLRRTICPANLEARVAQCRARGC